MTRHVGAVQVPLSALPVLTTGLPPSERRHLQRLKHGMARKELNGFLCASLWCVLA